MPPDPPTPHLFLCNGARLSTRRKPWRDLVGTELTTSGAASNVVVKIGEIARTLTANVPERAADLIEIAASIYVADQLAKRTGRKTQDYGDLWYRDIRMEIAVRDPNFWSQDSVAGLLSRMLNFISGDNIEFAFSEQTSAAPVGNYLDFGVSNPNPDAIEKVLLFSGGIDSLGGAVQEVGAGRRVALVSHKPAGHVAGLQKSLVADLIARSSMSGRPPLPVSVWCHKKGLAEQDHTQRTRSFLYVALGAVVARTFGLDAVDLFENGVVSINLPLAQHEFGARATRTTHPQTLSWFGQLLSEVFGRKFVVRNDFLWLTKQDVVELIKRADQGPLLASTVSCMHTRETTKASPHCGFCSQCVSRRFATLGVDNGALEPTSLYRHDVLTAARQKTEDRIIAERFLGFAREVEAMSTSEQFAAKYAAELARVTRFIPMTPSSLVDQVFDLHHRHAKQVNAVMVEAMRRSAEDQYHGNVQDGSMLSFAFRTAGLAVENAKCPAGTAAVNDAAPNLARPLTRDELLVLEILAAASQTMIQTDLVSATESRKHPLSRKTVGHALRALRELDLISYPRGPRKGAAITPVGLAHVRGAAAH